jgi:hypothetical protein
MRNKGLPRVLVPPWNLEIVNHTLKKWPFELLRIASNKFLMWKTIFLVAVASACRVRELHPMHVNFGSEEDMTLLLDTLT